MSRRLLVDTNNLMIDILPGTGSALEPFKRAHRGVDALKAVEEKKKMELENKRRKKLIKENKLCDPDIEKVVLVGNNNNLASMVNALDEKGDGKD